MTSGQGQAYDGAPYCPMDGPGYPLAHTPACAFHGAGDAGPDGGEWSGAAASAGEQTIEE